MLLCQSYFLPCACAWLGRGRPKWDIPALGTRHFIICTYWIILREQCRLCGRFRQHSNRLPIYFPASMSRACMKCEYLHPKVNLILLSANCRFCQVKRCGLNYRDSVYDVRVRAPRKFSPASFQAIKLFGHRREEKNTRRLLCLAYFVGLKCLWFPNRVTFQKKVNFVWS